MQVEGSAVQAVGLDLLGQSLLLEGMEAVADNVCVWMGVSQRAVLTAAVRHVSRLTPERAEILLIDLAQDGVRPLEARIVAVRALAALQPAVQTERLIALFSNPAQQVRLAAVLALRECSDPAVQHALVNAVHPSLLTEDAAVLDHQVGNISAELGAPKEGNTAQSKIRITPDGAIVSAGTVMEQQTSTLSPILSDTEEVTDPAVMAEDTPEEAAPKRRKRRAVEGPDAVARSLSLDVMRNCAALLCDEMWHAIALHFADLDDDVRLTAWKAASTRVAAGIKGGAENASFARVALNAGPEQPGRPHTNTCHRPTPRRIGQGLHL